MTVCELPSTTLRRGLLRPPERRNFRSSGSVQSTGHEPQTTLLTADPLPVGVTIYR